MKKISSFLLILLFILQTSKAQWTLTGTPFSGTVRGIFFTNVDTGYAVGAGGAISKTTDGGITWISQTSGVASDLRAVHFVNSTLGYISGAAGVVLKTINGGDTWEPANTGISSVTLRAIDFTSADTGFAGASAGVIYNTTDGGISWNSISLGIASDIIQLDMYDENVGYAVACDGTLSNGYVLKTTDGGITWTEIYYDATIGFLGLGVADLNTVYAGGKTQTIIKTDDGGSSWTVHSPNEAGAIRSGFVLSESQAYLVDDIGKIISTENGGISWNVSEVANENGIFSIHFIDFVGYLGTALGNIYKLTLCIPGEFIAYYADKDADGFGDPLDTVMDGSCIAPNGYVVSSTDCNDTNTAINPVATEIFNGIDDNCNGVIDEQVEWNQKADFGGGPRGFSSSFSIGSKGYLGGNGQNATEFKKDFWEYDPDSDTWTQKADFAGPDNEGVGAFSIGDKGYIGPGYNGGKELWEYDPNANSWTGKAIFGGPGVYGVTGFSIGTKGYMGLGYDFNDALVKDFWEYDPNNDTWTQKADFGGEARAFAVSFGIGSKGYIGTGVGYGGNYLNDFWEYDPDTNHWTQKADFGGAPRSGAVGFNIGNKGYIGTGEFNDGASHLYKDFWEYDPIYNFWIQKSDLSGGPRVVATGFSIGNKGYIGTGIGNGGNYFNDFWEYTPTCNGYTVYADADADNYGDAASSFLALDCIVPSGYVIDSTDCNDANGSIHPGVPDVINGIDDDCNGIVDDLVCATPVNLSVVSTNGTKAKLTWNAVGNAMQYNVFYKTSGTASWNSVRSAGNVKTISGLTANTQYRWYVIAICNKAPAIVSNRSAESVFTTNPLRVMDETPEPLSFQIYPNPTQGNATIQLTLAQSSHVSVKVCDVNGKEIAMLLDDVVDQGDHLLQFNTDHFAKGVYLVKITSELGMENQKLIVQ